MNPIEAALTAARDAFDRRAHHHLERWQYWQKASDDPNQHSESDLHWQQYRENVELGAKMRSAIEYIKENLCFAQIGMDDPDPLRSNIECLADDFAEQMMGETGQVEDFIVAVFLELPRQTMRVEITDHPEGGTTHKWRWIENQEQK